MHENDISQIIFDSGLKIHRELGAGLLESAYEECLFYELKKAGLFVEKQKAMPLIYQEVKLDVGYRLDLLVENKVVVEIKAQETLDRFHAAQLLNYLKLGNYRLGLLLNFNSKLFKNGINRVINGYIK